MEQVTERLRAAGLRVTAPRVSVLGVLDSSEDHPRVDQVIERVRAAGVSISTQATYDVCEALHRAGLARRIAPAGGPVRYESRVGDNHHHLVCRVVRRRRSTSTARSARPAASSRRIASGFTIDEAEVTFWGLLPPLPEPHRRRDDPRMSENGKTRKNLTTRQGHPVYDNQNQRTVGDRGPATLENYHFLEKMSHFDRERIPERVVHARGDHVVRLLRGDGQGRRRADLEVHAREALPGGRQADRRRRALLDRGRRPRLLRGDPRPARLRGEVLHRGRQLGPRRQQPRRLLHPRRDQVPRLHPLPEARPGLLRAPGPQPRLRLHLPEPGVDAHGHARVRPARHPRQLPHDAGLRRQHLQVGQRGRRDEARQVPLAARSRASRAGPRPTPASCRAGSSAATRRSSTSRSSAASSRSGSSTSR